MDICPSWHRHIDTTNRTHNNAGSKHNNIYKSAIRIERHFSLVLSHIKQQYYQCCLYTVYCMVTLHSSVLQYTIVNTDCIWYLLKTKYPLPKTVCLQVMWREAVQFYVPYFIFYILSSVVVSQTCHLLITCNECSWSRGGCLIDMRI